MSRNAHKLLLLCHRGIHDADNFRSSLSRNGSSLKTSHRSTEIESCLRIGLHSWLAIAGYGAVIPLCIMNQNAFWAAYFKFHAFYGVICFSTFPTALMAIFYCKIGRALVKQNKQIKGVCSNAARSRYVQNRRVFLVFLATVFCYGVGTLPNFSNFFIILAGIQFLPCWEEYLGNIMRVAGSNSVNPLIYGIFDKKIAEILEIL